MSEVRIVVQAPSNIALVKYMGKKNAALNLPANPSVSMTLKSLCTVVELEISSRGEGAFDRADSHGGHPFLNGVRWIPELPRWNYSKRDWPHSPVVPQLRDRDISRVVKHMERVQAAVGEIFQKFGLESRALNSSPDSSGSSSSHSFDHPFVTFRTANTFPASSGIASSASSFAAVTLAMAAACARDPLAFEKAWTESLAFRRELAQISRQGSGSSCRSFEGPWVEWQEEEAFLVPSDMTPALAHFVILIKTEPKRVSSSEAHRLIPTSPLWLGGGAKGRVERAAERVLQVSQALSQGDLGRLARIAWIEAWEMHSLFHTCEEPFSYWEPGTIDGLHWFSQFFQSGPSSQSSVHSATHLAAHSSLSAPPLVTLDAGPNIHVMVEKSEREIWRQRLQEKFVDFPILEDEQGEGASLLGITAGAP